MDATAVKAAGEKGRILITFDEIGFEECLSRLSPNQRGFSHVKMTLTLQGGFLERGGRDLSESSLWKLECLGEFIEHVFHRFNGCVF